MTSSAVGQPTGADQATQPASMSDVLIALGEEKKLFLSIWILGTLAAVAFVFSLPRLYSSSTLILPPQQQQSSAAATLMQLGALAGVSGGAFGGGGQDEMYVAFLKTQRVQSALVEKFKLQQRYEVDTAEDARIRLAKFVQVSNDKKAGLISISVDDRDPEFAAQLANAHVDELRSMLESLSVTEAQQRRAFFAEQVERTRKSLRDAESRFKSEQERTGLVAVQVLAESGARMQVDLQSQIAAAEVQVQMLGRFMTSQSPQMQRALSQLAALKSKLATLQGGGTSSGERNVSPAQENAIQAYRDVQVLQASLEMLVRQLELAKLDEAREGPMLQQVDVAVPSLHPSKPKRLYYAVVSFILFFLLGSVLAYFRWLSRQPLGAKMEARRNRLKRAWF